LEHTYLWSVNKEGSYGYSIDKIARGYTDVEMDNQDFEAVCEADDSKEAKCYQGAEPTVYNKSKAIARLLINGTGTCTGWLIGSEGHLMTNNHCIENVSDANNVTVEFMAEGANCDSDCASRLGCSGTVVATSTILIQTDVPLDYSLLKLPVNVSSTYGYLQFRNAGPVLNERIYIPQHPKGWGKRIALESDVDSGGFPSITSLTEPRCGGYSGNDVGYFADTRRGSSGSPVISYNDNLVVALHHCANCLNRGVASDMIISNLGANLPQNAAQIFGCINPVACNYNPVANTDDGSCDYGNTGCPDPCSFLSCFTVGCTNPSACNYDPTAVFDDGSCYYGFYTGCPDPCNFWSCSFTSGCTDPLACNYDPGAIFNDGSCEYGYYLCADPCNPCFIIDDIWIDTITVIPVFPPDDPCLFPPCGDICLSCPDDLLMDPVIDPLINIGINPKLEDTELSTNVANAFTIFPNPTNGKATITLEQDAKVPHTFTVFDLTGKIIEQSTFTGNKTNLDLSEVAKGMYMIKIQNDQTKDSFCFNKIHFL